MTLFEILNFNRELLERLAGTGYKPDDYKYIDLYREYEQMRRKGDKVTYCVAFLSARHGVSERKVYEILGRFKKECIVNAANEIVNAGFRKGECGFLQMADIIEETMAKASASRYGDSI